MRVWKLGGVYFLAFLLNRCWAKADSSTNDDLQHSQTSNQDVNPTKNGSGAVADNLGSAGNKSGVQEEHQAAYSQAVNVLSRSGTDNFAALQHNAAVHPGSQDAHKSQGDASGKSGANHVVSHEANRQTATNKEQPEKKISSRSREDYDSFEGPSLAEEDELPISRFHPATAIDVDTQAESERQEQTTNILRYQEYPVDKSNSGSSAEASANALAEVNGGSASAGATASATSEAITERRMGARLVPSSRSFLPPDTSEPNGIVCRQQGEMYYYWSPEYECSVCACVTEYGMLRAKCASCGGCQLVPDNQLPAYPPSIPMPAPPIPAYPPIPAFPTEPAFPPNPIFPPVPALPPLPPYPKPPAPAPSPSSNTCAPLPTNTPFQNPLNPCQICICNQVTQPVGGPDIQIVCEDNPDCVVPPDVTPLPPLPPSPTPQPLCDKLPQNVWFPHPNEECQNCQCTVELNPFNGLLEPYITCVTLPECTPSIPPRPVSPGLPPLPALPRPAFPVLSPSPHPGLAPAPDPPRPSPLPGPKPHQTCRPFTPNVPFEHPWDTCQSCVCEESAARGLINIEVNCYTKKECCIEAPISVVPAPPRPVALPTAPIYLDPSCRYRPPNQPFQDGCNLCTCNIIYNYVVAQCTKVPDCGGNGGASSSASASAIAAATAAANSESTYPMYTGPSDGGSASASAEAVASATSSVPSSNYPGAIYPGTLGGGLASASADASAIANAGSSYPGSLYPGSSYPGSLYPGSLYPGSINHGTTGGLASASADASAIANAGYLYPGSKYPGTNGGGLASASADASAIANTGSSYPGSIYPGTTGGLASASADASAVSNAGSSYPGSLYPGSINYGTTGGLASASADASAIANGGSLYPGSIYPGTNGGKLASASADASAIANTGSSYPGSLYPGSIHPKTTGLASASADASAIANAGSSYPGSVYPVASYPTGLSSAEALASANAIAEASSYNSPYGPLNPVYSPSGYPTNSFPGNLFKTLGQPSLPASEYGNNYPLSPSFETGNGGSSAFAMAKAKTFRSGDEGTGVVETEQSTSIK